MFDHRRYLDFIMKRQRALLRQAADETHNDYGFPLTVRGGVYPAHPDLTGSPSAIIAQLPVRMEGLDLLDIGTGSGVIAITAALRGARVMASDLSMQAVRLATLNTQLNGLTSRIDIVQGDLFSGLASRKFDLITANLWFPIRVWGFRADRRTCLDMQARFFEQVRRWLKPGGRVIMASADFADNRAIRKGMARHGIKPQQTILTLTHDSGRLKINWRSYSFTAG
ncbi:MAG: methyltransferase [Asticcacaulis sp.]|uniref:methyltransferase n=1 Tax=Asticcacaulis sp. TaxID=1872648 RepID=UPI0039E4546B